MLQVTSVTARAFSGKTASVSCCTYWRSARYSHSVAAEAVLDPPPNPADCNSQRFILYSRQAGSALFSRPDCFVFAAASAVAHPASSSASRCKPTQNALIESFNGKFRDECLNQNWFVDLRDAREVIDAWRVDHNTVHPHSSVRYLTPEEFAESVAARPASPSTPVVSIDPAWAGSDVQEPRSANL